MNAWFLVFLLTAIAVVGTSWFLVEDEPVVAATVSIVSLIVGWIWRNRNSSRQEHILVGIQEGLIGGGVISILLLLVKFITS